MNKILNYLFKKKTKKPDGPIPIPFPLHRIIVSSLDYEKVIFDIELSKALFFQTPKEEIEERLYYSFSQAITRHIKDGGFMEYTKTELPKTIKIRGEIYIGRISPPTY